MSACAIAEPEFALQAVHAKPLDGHFVADHPGLVAAGGPSTLVVPAR